MTTTTPQVLDVDEQTTPVIRERVPMAKLPAFFDRAFGSLAAALGRQGEVGGLRHRALTRHGPACSASWR